MCRTHNINVVTNLIKQIKELDRYEELDYNDLSKTMSFHELRELDIKLMCKNLIEYIEKNKDKIHFETKKERE